MREGWDNFCYFFLKGDGLCFFNGTLMGVVVVCQAIKFGTIFDIFFLGEGSYSRKVAPDGVEKPAYAGFFFKMLACSKYVKERVCVMHRGEGKG